MRINDLKGYTYKKLITVGIVGILVGIGVAWIGQGKFALLAGWDVAVLLYVVWIRLTVLSLDAHSTKTHAVREDPGRATTDALLIIASLASLGAVLLLMLDASDASGVVKVLNVIVGLASIVASWLLVQTTFALKYARMYYGGDTKQDVDFNQKELPSYGDFLYLSFTIGMTYQVSDTDIKTKEMRRTVLRQSMLSYLYGTFIIATTINTLASLTK